MNRPVIIYTRFSPTARENCKSAEQQLDLCRSWCKTFSHEILSEHSDEYTSGKDVDRAGLQLALTEVCRTRGILLVWKLDRLSRNLKDSLDIITQLDVSKAHLASVTEQIDTSTPMGRCFFAVIMAFAQLNREETADRIRKFMRGYQANGQIMGRKDRLPYGFKPDPFVSDHCIPDAYEQETTREILDLRNEGLSLRKIAAEMDNRGFKRRGGKFWTRGGVPLIGRIIKAAKDGVALD